MPIIVGISGLEADVSMYPPPVSCSRNPFGIGTILFDLVDFTVENDSRSAEVAGILLGCYAFHGDRLYYLDQVLEDTTAAELQETVSRLRKLDSQPMQHPGSFFNRFDDWEGHLLGFARRPGHPMRDLVSLLVNRPQD